MSAPDESQLLAVVATGEVAAMAVFDTWADGHAVALLDPAHPDLSLRLQALAPTRVVDANGVRPFPGGRPVPAGVGAVVATSGTTGTARFVMLDHTALAASARAVTTALGLDPARDRWLACLPLHHIAGLAILARSAVTGVPVTVHDRFVSDRVAAAAGDCSVVSMVPTTLGRLLATAPEAVGRFRHVVLGGGPIDPDLVTAATGIGTQVTTTYGLTETGGGCVHDGHPFPGVEIALAPETDEILVRGPVVMRGYRAAQPEAQGSPAVTDDGWLATGDVGRWAADGRLEVVDRRKDLIITGGVNVSPVRIESRLAHAPGVADLAVVGTPDPEWGEHVVACVAPAADQEPSLAALQAYGRDRGLSGPELPRRLHLIAAVPRSPGGKILRRQLRAELTSGVDQADGGT